MPWTKLIANEYMAMEYSPEKKIIYHTFYQTVEGVIFRECLMVGLEIIQKHGVQKWLSDDRKNRSLRPEDVQWAMHEWADQAIAAGWKYWAIIVPEDEAGRDSMTNVRNFYKDKGIKVMVFLNPKAALEWLEAL